MMLKSVDRQFTQKIYLLNIVKQQAYGIKRAQLSVLAPNLISMARKSMQISATFLRPKSVTSDPDKSRIFHETSAREMRTSSFSNCRLLAMATSTNYKTIANSDFAILTEQVHQKAPVM